jgi:nitrile hydratase
MHADHSHAHGHDHLPDRDGPLSDYQLMEIAVRELLIEKGILTADEIRRAVEAMDARSPAIGARVVARAWVDPAYKQRLLTNATAAIRELGFSGLQGENMVAVENTGSVHNVIVCTLCSCYPWPVLGLPPVWYKSAAYRSRVVKEPRAVLAEFGLKVPAATEVRVWDSSAEIRYMVVPRRPDGTDGLSEAALADLVTRDGMVGTAAV